MALPRQPQLFERTLADAIAGDHPGTGCAVDFLHPRQAGSHRGPVSGLRADCERRLVADMAVILPIALARRLISDFDEQRPALSLKSGQGISPRLSVRTSAGVPVPWKSLTRASVAGFPFHRACTTGGPSGLAINKSRT